MFLNVGMICMVCTTLGVVHYCICVCMFPYPYATHLWAGTGPGLVYIPQSVHSICCNVFPYMYKNVLYNLK